MTNFLKATMTDVRSGRDSWRLCLLATIIGLGASTGHALLAVL